MSEINTLQTYTGEWEWELPLMGLTRDSHTHEIRNIGKHEEEPTRESWLQDQARC